MANDTNYKTEEPLDAEEQRVRPSLFSAVAHDGTERRENWPHNNSSISLSCTGSEFMPRSSAVTRHFPI